MLRKFIKSGNYKLLLDSIEEGYNCSVFGLNIGEKLALVENSAFLFYVVESLDDVTPIYEKLTSLGRKCAVLSDFINIFTSEFYDYQKIIEVVHRIKTEQVDTVILTPSACLSQLPTLLDSIQVSVGDDLDVIQFGRKLISLGYKRVDLVANKGEYSIRGDVVDVYSIGGEPTRIIIDYDIVESVKTYNPVTMLTSADIKHCSILSCDFYKVNKSIIDEFYENNNLKKDELYLEFIENDNVDFRKIIFDRSLDRIFDMVPDSTIVFDGAKKIYNTWSTLLDDYSTKIKEQYKAKNNPFAGVCIDIKDILKFSEKSTLIAYHYIQENNRIFSPQRVFSIRTLQSINYHNHDNVLLLDVQNYLKLGYTVILCSGSDDYANKLNSFFTSNRLTSFIYPRVSMCNSNALNIVSKKYPLDIILPEEKLAVISTESLFGKQKRVVDIDSGFFDGETPREGDYVVHHYHGVGKCLGVQTLKMNGNSRDYFVIEYKNNDKLFLPVENVDQISKYVGSDKEPTLNKIGGVEFAKTKAKVKTAVKKIAFDLIQLYRERMNAKGYKYLPDEDMQIQFENTFPYDETADQLSAIQDCKKDLESGKVMDRLVCGDVGFGKTEVALRIAFKTIVNGKQVALLCPTTILSEQHYNTALARMSNFGIKVAVLNRLKSVSEVTKIKQEFSQGKIDMIVGTHKLLASDIDYKNLGLLILDEEQKFGVADKEKIKNFKKAVNVLTLSATPIPRTLNLSLIGVRDISVIETPPVQRLSSDVQVIEYSDSLIVSAVEREITRGGQVLVIYNRVEKIHNFASHLKSLLPDVCISVAHGQMTDLELETEIYNLYSGKTQLLVATTILENGVDLPNANTLIVINSDMLGLSQLYQLKGRIGRSDKSSYAYFTFDNRKMLTDNAYKRLSAIKEFSEMGSGFKIAMRDLEIRGAGSLLGLEQSGHIEKIGYNLYVELLDQSVRELKGERILEKTDVRVETNMSAYLPHIYVESSSKRMSMYRQIANLSSVEDMVKFITDTQQVYGDMPTELIVLCKIALIKNYSSRLGATKVVIRENIEINLSGKENLSQELLDNINDYGDNVSLNLISQPVIIFSGKSKLDLLDFVINFLQIVILP